MKTEERRGERRENGERRLDKHKKYKEAVLCYNENKEKNNIREKERK